MPLWLSLKERLDVRDPKAITVLLKLWAIAQLPGLCPLCVLLSRYWQLFRGVRPFRCIQSNSVPFLSINSSSIWIHLLLMVAQLHLPCPVALPCLNKNEANFFHRSSHCVICWVKHTGPLLECHEAVCLQCNKSLQAVTQAVLWHYSQQRGTLLMLTNTAERGSFTTHPLSSCQYKQQRCLLLSQGHVCVPLPSMKSLHLFAFVEITCSQILLSTTGKICKLFFLFLKKQKPGSISSFHPSTHPSIYWN